MIKIRRSTDRATGEQVCYFNGRRAFDTSLGRPKKGRWELSTRDGSLRNILLEIPIEQLHVQFSSLDFDIDGQCHRFIDECHVDLWQKQLLKIGFVSWQEYDQWKQPFTVDEFFSAIERVTNSFDAMGVEISADSHEKLLSFHFALADPAARLSEELKHHLPVVREILDRALDEVHSTIPPDSLVAYFRFPVGIQAACTQYLAYFTQFLQDLGVDATADIKQEAHRVLFTVTPSSSEEALHRVREALIAYLTLPSVRDSIRGPSEGTDISTMQLMATIDHLRSQLEFSRVAISAKDMALQSLELTNFLTLGMLRGSGMYAQVSAPKVQEESADAEPLMGKVVSVTKLRFKGLQIDLPEILRKLKRVWRK